jgi:hypothetical protein
MRLFAKNPRMVDTASIITALRPFSCGIKLLLAARRRTGFFRPPF